MGSGRAFRTSGCVRYHRQPGFHPSCRPKGSGCDPAIPIVNYVSPSVWAWRPGRARAMRGYVDHVLALLPFEPQAHARLGGPPCEYVGHPSIERLDELRPNAEEEARRQAERQVGAHPVVAMEVEQQSVAPVAALDPRRLSAQAVLLVGVVPAAERDVAVIRHRRVDLDVLGAVGSAEREPSVLGRRGESDARS